MHHFIEYLIKLSVTLMILYLFYWLVLSRLTFYNSNRWYLLGYSIVAFFIPFIDISPVLEQVPLINYEVVQWIPVVETTGLQINKGISGNIFEWSKWSMAFLLFCGGTMLMVVRFIIQYFSVRSVRRASRLISDGEVKVYHNDKNIIPFSFGNSIFINQKKHSEDELRDIIKHEFIHVKQKHTIDILWSEWLCILNWYNPFAWLIRHAIRQNLEFIADNEVVLNGIDKKQYQYLLLKVIGVPHFGIATNFNFTSLKKRIAMMNKIRSAKVHFIKFLFILPVMAVILLAFRNQSRNREIKWEGNKRALSATTDEQTVQTNMDTVPLPQHQSVKPRPHSFYIAPANSKGYIVTIADNHGECVVIVKNKQNKIVKAVSLVEWDENKKNYVEQYGEIPPVRSVSQLDKTEEKSTPLTEPMPGPIPQATPVPSKVSTPNPINALSPKNKVTLKMPVDFDGLIIVNDKEYNKKSFEDEVNLNEYNIRSIDVLKGESAKQLYGEKGKNGVIKIVTK